MKFRILFIACTILSSINFFGQNYVYQEEFNSKGTWTQNNNDIRELYTSNGRYYFEHKRTEDYREFTTRSFSLNAYNDFEIETSIQKISGVDNYGICFLYDYKDEKNYKEFGITSGGYYRVAGATNGTYKNEKSWTESSYIKEGNYAVNNLKIKKSGNTISYYINGNFLYSMNFSSLVGNRIAFRLYRNQKISIDYIRVKGGTSSTNNTYTNNNNSHTVKETILFDGYTDNANNWSTSKSNNADLDIRNGNYYFSHKRDNGGWSSTIPRYINTNRDFKIVADIKKESGINNNGYGIIFGRKDTNNQNLFFVNGNGSYSINRIKNGKDNYLKEWTPSSTIRKGNGAYNVLKVVKQGNKLEYYINNTRVHTDYSPEFFGDRLGYIIYNRQEISVGYLSVGYLDKRSTVDVNTNLTDNIKNETYSDSQYFFSEQYSNNSNNWFETSDDKIDFKVRNGKYYLKHKRNEKGWSTYSSKYIDTSKDFEIETKIDKVSGLTNYGYGLIFGKKDNNDFRFYISSSGYYKVARMVDNKEQTIQKWIKTEHVNTGNAASNKLKVKKEGGNYKFYLNDTFVYQSDFEPFFGTQLGFVLYNNQEIAVDYLRVKYLGANTTVVKNETYQLPFSENFSNNSKKWATDNLDNYESALFDGSFIIHRKKEGGIFISKDVNIDNSKDFIIETSISRKLAGANGLYGLTFGRKNSSNEFSFLISTNGSYMFRKFENDVYSKIIPFTTNDAIKTGISERNKIKIVKSNNLLRFYINDVYVNEAPFQNFFGNNIGFTAYYEQKISVDYLNIKYQTSGYNDPPVVVITEPTVEAERGFKIVKAKRIQVKGKATDKDGIFEVLVNGVDAQVFEDGSFVANVPLKIGSNDLEVKATDLKQSSSIKTFTIKRKSPEIDVVDTDVDVPKNDKLDIGFGKYYALLIGVSDYNEASGVESLEGLPTKDAQDLKNVLVKKYNFEEENIIMLDDSPTENEILREFVKLKKKVTNKDNVLIFYAGHGIYDEATETGSWLPSDADPEYGLNMISNSTIKDYIKGIDSKHTLLISDACFSGSIFKTRSYKTAPKSITRKFELPSRKAITSGTLKTVPNKSVFLKYLIDRLTKNESPYLTARKIFDSIEEPVMNNSKNVPQYGTIQEVGDEGGDFIFIKRN